MLSILAPLNQRMEKEVTRVSIVTTYALTPSVNKTPDIVWFVLLQLKVNSIMCHDFLVPAKVY